eukprot:TRINITY_DN17484_c0_g1_i1.p1 TRINITY_DN17484_c0_g1~~TRINITY_DN17484_c0_g1_i1.p1  ORF type:complete len:1869 (+),score=537.40 TRINITY_DN17484_c0_g1_i1:141-5747(+)
MKPRTRAQRQAEAAAAAASASGTGDPDAIQREWDAQREERERNKVIDTFQEREEQIKVLEQAAAQGGGNDLLLQAQHQRDQLERERARHNIPRPSSAQRHAAAAPGKEKEDAKGLPPPMAFKPPAPFDAGGTGADAGPAAKAAPAVPQGGLFGRRADEDAAAANSGLFGLPGAAPARGGQNMGRQAAPTPMARDRAEVTSDAPPWVAGNAAPVAASTVPPATGGGGGHEPALGGGGGHVDVVAHRSEHSAARAEFLRKRQQQMQQAPQPIGQLSAPPQPLSDPLPHDAGGPYGAGAGSQQTAFLQGRPPEQQGGVAVGFDDGPAMSMSPGAAISPMMSPLRGGDAVPSPAHAFGGPAIGQAAMQMMPPLGLGSVPPVGQAVPFGQPGGHPSMGGFADGGMQQVPMGSFPSGIPSTGSLGPPAAMPVGAAATPFGGIVPGAHAAGAMMHGGMPADVPGGLGFGGPSCYGAAMPGGQGAFMPQHQQGMPQGAQAGLPPGGVPPDAHHGQMTPGAVHGGGVLPGGHQPPDRAGDAKRAYAEELRRQAEEDRKRRQHQQAFDRGVMQPSEAARGRQNEGHMQQLQQHQQYHHHQQPPPPMQGAMQMQPLQDQYRGHSAQPPGAAYGMQPMAGGMPPMMAPSPGDMQQQASHLGPAGGGQPPAAMGGGGLFGGMGGADADEKRKQRQRQQQDEYRQFLQQQAEEKQKEKLRQRQEDERHEARAAAQAAGQAVPGAPMQQAAHHGGGNMAPPEQQQQQYGGMGAQQPVPAMMPPGHGGRQLESPSQRQAPNINLIGRVTSAEEEAKVRKRDEMKRILAEQVAEQRKKKEEAEKRKKDEEAREIERLARDQEEERRRMEAEKKREEDKKKALQQENEAAMRTARQGGPSPTAAGGAAARAHRKAVVEAEPTEIEEGPRGGMPPPQQRPDLFGAPPPANDHATAPRNEGLFGLPPGQGSNMDYAAPPPFVQGGAPAPAAFEERPAFPARQDLFGQPGDFQPAPFQGGGCGGAQFQQLNPKPHEMPGYGGAAGGMPPYGGAGGATTAGLQGQLLQDLIQQQQDMHRQQQEALQRLQEEADRLRKEREEAKQAVLELKEKQLEQKEKEVRKLHKKVQKQMLMHQGGMPQPSMGNLSELFPPSTAGGSPQGRSGDMLSPQFQQHFQDHQPNGHAGPVAGHGGPYVQDSQPAGYPGQPVQSFNGHRSPVPWADELMGAPGMQYAPEALGTSAGWSVAPLPWLQAGDGDAGDNKGPHEGEAAAGMAGGGGGFGVVTTGQAERLKKGPTNAGDRMADSLFEDSWGAPLTNGCPMTAVPAGGNQGRERGDSDAGPLLQTLSGESKLVNPDVAAATWRGGELPRHRPVPSAVVAPQKDYIVAEAGLDESGSLPCAPVSQVPLGVSMNGSLMARAQPLHQTIPEERNLEFSLGAPPAALMETQPAASPANAVAELEAAVKAIRQARGEGSESAMVDTVMVPSLSPGHGFEKDLESARRSHGGRLQSELEAAAASGSAESWAGLLGQFEGGRAGSAASGGLLTGPFLGGTACSLASSRSSGGGVAVRGAAAAAAGGAGRHSCSAGDSFRAEVSLQPAAVGGVFGEAAARPRVPALRDSLDSLDFLAQSGGCGGSTMQQSAVVTPQSVVSAIDVERPLQAPDFAALAASEPEDFDAFLERLKKKVETGNVATPSGAGGHGGGAHHLPHELRSPAGTGSSRVAADARLDSLSQVQGALRRERVRTGSPVLRNAASSVLRAGSLDSRIGSDRPLSGEGAVVRTSSLSRPGSASSVASSNIPSLRELRQQRRKPRTVEDATLHYDGYGDAARAAASAVPIAIGAPGVGLHSTIAGEGGRRDAGRPPSALEQLRLARKQRPPSGDQRQGIT